VWLWCQCGWLFCRPRYVGYWTTRGYANSRIANSRTGQLADWSTRGLDNSRTGQVADWTTRGCRRRLSELSFPFWRHLRDRELSSPRLVQSASWLVRELSSPRVDQSTRYPVRELAYPLIVQLPVRKQSTALTSQSHTLPCSIKYRYMNRQKFSMLKD